MNVIGMRGDYVDPGQFVRHGSDEQGSHRSRGGIGRRIPSTPRVRSRERGERSETPTHQRVRAGPAGQEERRDWLDALRDVTERLGALETATRHNAQTASKHTLQIDELQNISVKLIRTSRTTRSG